MFRQYVWTIGLAGCLLTTGCVERRFVITTDPPGAVVLDEKNLRLGGTPADRQFTYYGKYRFTVMRDGYQTQIVEEDIKAPWYEWFLIDFFSENLWPGNIRDIRRIHVPLTPAQISPPEQVLQQAEQLRTRGQGIGTAPPAPPVLPTQPMVAGANQ